MADDHAGATGDYLSSTRSVLQAARRLRRDLDADVARRGFAIEQLERAAGQQQDSAAGFRSFMFSELKTATVPEHTERVAEDTLASISADLHVANVLVAAGETVGETGARAAPHLLDEAILRLDNTTQAVEQSLPDPLRRFGFTEDVSGSQPVEAPDLSSATESFRQNTDKALNSFVNDAKGAAGKAISALSGIDSKQVLDAISKLGGAVEAPREIGLLFKRGIKKLMAAIAALTRLMGSKALAGIKDEVKQFWEDAQKNKPIDRLLGWAIGVEAARVHVTEVLAADGLGQEALGKGSIEMGKLPAMFKGNMEIAGSMAVAVTFTGTLVAWLAPGIGGSVLLIAALIDVLILASIILMGRDYTDSGDILSRVHGVCGIADGVRPA
jgi:hypothetical protein